MGLTLYDEVTMNKIQHININMYREVMFNTEGCVKIWRVISYRTLLCSSLLTYNPRVQGTDAWDTDNIMESLYNDYGTNTIEPITDILMDYLNKSSHLVHTILRGCNVTGDILNVAFVTDGHIQILHEI